MPDRPIVVTLCGSTRFRREYQRAFSEEEHAGRICLTVPCYKDDPCCKSAEDHARLDALHRHKIDISAEILVIAPGGYVGDSTRAEIAYASATGKRVRYWRDDPAGAATAGGRADAMSDHDHDAALDRARLDFLEDRGWLHVCILIGEDGPDRRQLVVPGDTPIAPPVRAAGPTLRDAVDAAMAGWAAKGGPIP